MSAYFDAKGRLIKSCGVPGCAAYPSFSDNANMRKKRAGDWFCGEHFKERQASKLADEKRQKLSAAPKTDNTDKQGQLF